ncbi:MAG: protein kinase [Planctomycetaceae bacterium]|nr:protein kinase [Planctomycetaceae bacterium]
MRRAAAERTLAAGGGGASADGTMLPGTRDSAAFAGVIPSSTVEAPPPSRADLQHRATADTSVSLANPSIKTIEATDTPPILSSLNTVATDYGDDAGSGKVTVNGIDDESLGASSAGPAPRRFDSVATVDPRYFGPSEWNRWSKELTGKPESSAMRSVDSADARRSTSTDSRYVGRTPVSARPLTPQGAPPMPGDEYAIVSRLGEGGMGIVYTATQRAIARDVALKMLKPDTARRRDRRDSLATEAIVTGELAHPNIVPVYDLGQDADGSLFYSMKRVEGIRWDTVIGTKTESENLDILLRVADAVAFAHDRGVVNRDLKPENVFLGGFGEVLVMDWGLAYATDKFKKHDSVVENVSMGGSPAYMAPEQARNFLVASGWRAGELEPITPALDVYLLGAMLFEIVTGQPPHGSDDPTMCVMAAAENRIRHHGSDSQLLPIALKAMATESSDRYASALDFQRAIREYLAHAESLALTDRARVQMKEGDLARAVVAFEDALSLWPENPEAQTKVVVARRRLTRRRYALTAVTAGFFLAIASGGTASTFFWQEADAAAEKAITAADEEKKARQDAEREREQKEEQRLLAETRREEAEKQKKLADEERLKAVDAQKVAVREREEKEKQRLIADERRSEAEKQKNLADEEREKAVVARIEADEQRERQTYLRYKAEIANVDRWIAENKFSDANDLLDDLRRDAPQLCGWEWGRLKYLCTQGRQAVDARESITAAAAAPDGSFIVTAGDDGRVLLWDRAAFADPALGARLSLNVPPQSGLMRPRTVVVSPDGLNMAAAGEAAEAKPAILIWPTTTQENVQPRRLEGHEAGFRINTLAYSADGAKLLSASTNGEILVWDLTAGSVLARLNASESDVQNKIRISCAAVSPDGTRVVVGTGDGGGNAFVWTLAKTPTGLRFENQRTFLGHQSKRLHGDGFAYRSGAVTCVAFSPDGRYIYSGDGTGHVLRWDPETDALTHADLMAAQLKAAEQRVASVLNGKAAASAAGAAPLERFTAVAAYSDTSAVLSVTPRTAADGRTVIATAGENGVVKLWNAMDWNAGARDIDVLAEFRGHDGRVVSAIPVASGDAWDVFSAGDDGAARLGHVDTYAEVHELTHDTLAGHEDAILTAAFDPSGRYLMTAGAAQDRRLILTDLDNRRQRRESADIAGVAPGTEWVVPMPPEGRLLLTGSADGSTVLWDTKSRTALRRLFAQAGNALLAPAASLDGQWIATLYTPDPAKRAIAIWPTEELSQSIASEPKPIVVNLLGEPAAAAFTVDGRLLVSGDAPLELPPRGGAVYVTDPATGKTNRTVLFGDGEEGRVASIAAIAGGDVLIAGKAGKAADVRIVRWNPLTRKPAGTASSADPWAVTLAGAVDLVAMAADPSGKRLVTLATLRDRSQLLQLWDLTSLPTKPLVGQPLTALATSLSLAPDGRTLLMPTESSNSATEGEAGGEKQTAVWLLELETLAPITDGDVNGPLLSQKAIGRQAFPTGVTGIAFSPEGPTAFLAGARGVYEFDLKRRERLDGLFGSHGGVPSSGFSADGKYLISGRQDGSFDIYDASAEPPALPAVTLQAPGVYHSPVAAAAFSPVPESYMFLIAVGRSLELHEFDPVAGETRLVKSLTSDENGPTNFVGAAFSADGRWIVAAGEDGVVRLFDTKAMAGELAMIELTAKAFADGVAPVQHSSRATSVAVAAKRAPGDRLVIASGSEDQTAIVWVVDPASRRVDAAVPLRGHAKSVTAVAFAPGGFDRVVTGSADRTARLWDWDGGGIKNWEDSKVLAEIETTGETLTLSGIHTEGLTVVGFSPSGLTVLTAGQDGRAVLWPSEPPPSQVPAEAVRPTEARPKEAETRPAEEEEEEAPQP